MTALQIVDKQFSQVPIIDISALVYHSRNPAITTAQNCYLVAEKISRACQDYGFSIWLDMELMNNYKSS